MKSIAYFKATTLQLPAEEKTLKAEIIEKFPQANLQKEPYDIILISASEQKSIAELLLEPNTLHNDSMLLVDNIHQNKKNWQLLKQHNRVTVTIDLFHCGVVFFRTEQAKEHFKIRI